MTKKIKKQYSNVAPGHQLSRKCYEEEIKTLKKINAKSENKFDFFS